jgi:pimeloyl-ACP methyl ester carboxylesterase
MAGLWQSLLHPDRNRQSLGLALAEVRWGLEASTLVGALPFLTSAPRGDGHAILVLPGWLGDDASTLVLRSFLRLRGHRALGWKQGRNLGPRPVTVQRLRERVRALHAYGGRTVSLLGWSLGGVYARELAREMPELVRSVVTLASPFQIDPRRRSLWPDAELRGTGEPPPVPSTAVYSVSDGIVPPLWCREREGALTENVEVPGSHIGMGFNPLAFYVVAERLAQAEGTWRPFDVSGARRFFYRAGAPHPGR